MIAVIRRFMGKPACIEAFADLILSLLARAGKFKTDGLRERSVVEFEAKDRLAVAAFRYVRSAQIRGPQSRSSMAA
jgi:hypothetical protein